MKEKTHLKKTALFLYINFNLFLQNATVEHSLWYGFQE